MRLLCVALLVTAVGCASGMERSEGMDASGVPATARADYEVFSARCSKCHSLARPLNSGISDDRYWRLYVEKMQRQPGSGITDADKAPILRFLHWYSQSQTAKDGG